MCIRYFYNLMISDLFIQKLYLYGLISHDSTSAGYEQHINVYDCLLKTDETNCKIYSPCRTLVNVSLTSITPCHFLLILILK